MASKGVVGDVLVVDDHRPTARLIATAFEEVDPNISTHLVEDGDECLAVLRGEDDSTPEIDLILLDLDLGRGDVDGIAVLETKNEHSTLRRVPTVVLSGNDDPETIARCYDRGANTFISKPNEFDGYSAAVETLLGYWSAAELPSTEDSPDL